MSFLKIYWAVTTAVATTAVASITVVGTGVIDMTGMVASSSSNPATVMTG